MTSARTTATGARAVGFARRRPGPRLRRAATAYLMVAPAAAILLLLATTLLIAIQVRRASIEVNLE